MNINKKIEKWIIWNKKHIKDNWKKIIISYAFLALFIVIFLLVDLLTKQTIYEFADRSMYGNRGKFEFDKSAFVSYGNFIGFRSVLNHGITIAGSNDINVGAIQAISIIFSLFFLFVPYFINIEFKKDKWDKFLFILATGLAISGVLGNAVDRFAFGGVRDIVFAPYASNSGTFNFADTFIFTSISLFILYVILQFVISSVKKAKLEKEKQEWKDLFENKNNNNDVSN